MRMLTPLALVALLTLAPVVAQETEAQTDCPDGYVESPEGCSRQAWTDDCPPDMMCAAGAEGDGGQEWTDGGECVEDECHLHDTPIQFGNESCIECSGPILFGNESCIECSQAPPQTCMDGADEGEACDDDVQYLDGRGPADCELCRGDEADDDLAATDHKDASGEIAALLLVGMAGLVAFVRRR